MSERPAPDTRLRLVRATEQLLRVQGYSGTGLKQLTAAAAAPWGSLYHFFPGGKAELAAEAARYAGDFYAQGLRRAFEQCGDAGEAVEALFVAEARVLQGSDYRTGCPIAAMTMDTASTEESLRLACAAAFETWLAALAEGFEDHGAPRQAAHDLALFVLSAVEGAIVLTRAAKSPAPLLACAPHVRGVVDREAAGWRNRVAPRA